MRALALLLALALPASAQERQADILTVDSDALYSRSEYGQRVNEKLEADARALAAENKALEAELTAEEMALTEQRPDLAPEAFRELADAFDEKVQRTRAEQDEKARNLNERRDAAQARFLREISPVLEQIMRQSGASVILEQRSVFVSLTSVDITGAAIQGINQAIGSGEGLD